MKRNLCGLSEDDKAELIRTPEVQVSLMQDAVELNLGFLEKVTAIITAAQTSMVGDHLARVREDSCPSQKSVDRLLGTITREWSEEGQEERKECFERLLGALEAHLSPARDAAKSSGAAPPRVLCPSAQLGRLPFEVQRLGFTCEACEEQALAYFGSEFLRQNGAGAEAHCIRPYVLGTCNRVKAADNVRDVRFPEVAIAADSLPRVQLANFVRLYDEAAARATFDGVITSYCLDTNGNVFRYLRTVAHVMKPGGIWTNFGPLAFDQHHDEAHGQGIEISWEELKFAISHFFDIREEAIVDALFAENARAMMQFQYSCIYFSAIRNDKPVPGIGEHINA